MSRGHAQQSRGDPQGRLGIETANEVEVQSGLNEGDMVVIGGRSGLQPGQEVKPKAHHMAAANQ